MPSSERFSWHAFFLATLNLFLTTDNTEPTLSLNTEQIQIFDRIYYTSVEEQ